MVFWLLIEFLGAVFLFSFFFFSHMESVQIVKKWGLFLVLG